MILIPLLMTYPLLIAPLHGALRWLLVGPVAHRVDTRDEIEAIQLQRRLPSQLVIKVTPGTDY